MNKGGGKTANEYAVCQFNKEDLDYIKSVNSANLESENEEPKKGKKPTKKGKSNPSEVYPSEIYPSEIYTGGSINSTLPQSKPYTGGSINSTLPPYKLYPSSVQKENLNKSTKEKEKKEKEKISLSQDPPSGVPKNDSIAESVATVETRKATPEFIESTMGLLEVMTGGNRKSVKAVEKVETVQAKIEGLPAGGGYLTPIQPAEAPLERIGSELEVFQFTAGVDNTMGFLSEVFSYCEREGIEYSKNSKDSNLLWENSENFRAGFLSPNDILSRMRKHSEMRQFARQYKDMVKDKRFVEQFRTIVNQPVSVANSLNGWGAIIESNYTMYESLMKEISQNLDRQESLRQSRKNIEEIQRKTQDFLNGRPEEKVTEVVTPAGEVKKVV